MTEPIDQELYSKFKADLRVEHLLLEREVQNIISTLETKETFKDLNATT